MKETAVTAAVAAIADRDPAFGARVLRALVTSAAERTEPAASRAARLKRTLPRGSIQLKHQYYMEHQATTRELMRDFFLDKPAPWSSFLDWLWTTKSFALAVEVKTSKRPRFQAGQLDKYHRAFKYEPNCKHRIKGFCFSPPSSHELRSSSKPVIAATSSSAPSSGRTRRHTFGP